IYKRRFNNNGTPVENEVMVNDLKGTNNQNRSAIDMNTAGNVVVTWLDYRIPTGIYFQRLNILGGTLGENIRVDYGDDPDVTVANDSSFVITYQYSRTIYYQMFTLGGDSIGPPARASDTTYNYRYRPSIDIDLSGNFVITWYDNRNGNFDIYAQRFDSIGDTIGVNFRIDDDLGTSEQSYPAVAVSSGGRFIITWHDYRNGDFDIFGQVYNAGGNPVGTNFKINTDVGTQGQFYPDVASLPDGNFIIVWQDYRSGMGIYGQIIDFLGIPVDANFKISDVVAYWPCVDASDTGRFVVTWHDYRDGNTNIYAQSFNPDYTPYKGNYKVNNDIEGLNQGQIYPDLVTDGTNIIFTWDDTKWQRGYDIAAKVVGWEFSSSIDDGEYVEIPTMLLPNIPNPFVNSTLIRYQIDERQEIKIEIYDISGRLIRTLSSGIVEPGVHNLRWNGKDAEGKRVPAGIYFCRLSAGNRIQSRKMVMIK
ncbi:T9SS type A sorting domain-containing protein, partial [candidate division WOR-3 bacterium]|nr:T9SS type A sorting domain-containing protein [candidate division WOR-3 bacterium]